MSTAVYRLAEEIVGSGNAKQNEPMSAHTTFRIGGAADMYFTPGSADEIARLVKLLRQHSVPCYIIGNGSNLLVGDKGIRGAVVEIGRGFGDISVSGSVVTAQSGVLLSKLSNFAASKGLSGLEFASGIPGSLGGAVYMNAGAYGGEMKDVVTRVVYLSDECEVCELSADECCFDYRRSFFSDKNCVILAAEMQLKERDTEAIRADMRELSAKRTAKQPVDKPSAGSTFKRPAGGFAAALIEQAGLKGFSVGGAMVSDKHSGFVINNGGATAEDVVRLIEHIKEKVMEVHGIELQTEVKLIGEF
ncbi:MAG TPA: UDP-N-acetylmuramate dehydrogenase [Candidatus Monoglobus merdigallinarum]|uniref:UDP-N-acetylenolpyruvoylglucosamine reductase n=1 Tax=Candidatus Monoglobus merdigallinarum TaxID=2838698 RepID=A0A9D1TLR3_9FIRM|nr:UDP-N-acetylmuramate dehydrogenase [Candidatus Monoglobus merdigallinarum]